MGGIDTDLDRFSLRNKKAASDSLCVSAQRLRECRLRCHKTSSKDSCEAFALLKVSVFHGLSTNKNANIANFLLANKTNGVYNLELP